MNDPLSQLSFEFMSPERCHLDEYFWGSNLEVKHWFDAIGQDSFKKQCTYLHGGHRSGITHLLKGLADQLKSHGSRAVYLPMRTLRDYPDYLDQWQCFDWIIIDDLEFIQESHAWQEKIFGLYEALIGTDHNLVVGSHLSPYQLDLSIQDLSSRLRNFWVLSLHSLDDDAKYQCLLQYIEKQGLSMDEAVLDYLMTHVGRDIGELLMHLKSAESVAAIRRQKITIRLVRSILVR